MKSVTTPRFRNAFDQLPTFAKESSYKAFHLWQQNPFHPGLKFKKIHSVKPIYSVRIGIAYRAVGRIEDDKIIWFWIGSHSDYDKLIKLL